MEPIDTEDLKHFIGGLVEIAIHDQEGNDQAPAVKKSIKKIQYCPDGTHIRFYFDDFYFLAVPLLSKIHQTESSWSAFDSESCLHYKVKKVQVF